MIVTRYCIAGHVVADADSDELDRRSRLDLLDFVPQVALQIMARIDRKVESSTGAPSEIIIRILRCSGRASSRR